MSHFRKLIYQKLEPAEKWDWTSRYLDLFLIGLIAVNVIAVILETVTHIAAQYGTILAVIEAVSVTIFSLEYVARVWCSVEDARFRDQPYPRLRYMLSPLAIIDLLAILPFFLGFVVTIDLRFLWVFRLLRILKLTRYSAAMSMLLEVFQEEANTFFAGFFILIMLLVVAASGAYLAEHQAQPDSFGSIPAAMWWAVATLTTVGYGDVAPVTPAGRIFGSFVAVVGIGMAALPAGILASGLADRLRRTRVELADKFRQALEDDVIDEDEEKELEALRRELGLSKRIAAEIRSDVQQARKVIVCPHCGRDIGRQDAVPSS